jgi:flagellar hook assembly protein FlgD
MNIKYTINPSNLIQCKVTVYITDFWGTTWRTIDGGSTAGIHDVVWDGKGDMGNPDHGDFVVPSGPYWVNVVLTGINPLNHLSVTLSGQAITVAVNCLSFGELLQVSSAPASFTPNGTLFADISYTIGLPGSLDLANISLIVTDQKGNVVYTANEGDESVPQNSFQGTYIVKWYGKNNAGNILPPGTYKATIKMEGTDSGLTFYYISSASTIITIT